MRQAVCSFLMVQQHCSLSRLRTASDSTVLVLRGAATAYKEPQFMRRRKVLRLQRAQPSFAVVR